jgi:hypothetical protein
MQAVKKMSKNSSRMIKAFEGWKEGLKSYSQPPSGMFGRVAIIETGGVKLNSEELDLEYTVPFDDDTEANEAEIVVYNLSKTTIDAIKYNNPISITSGYRNDTGVIFEGFISKVITKCLGVDKVTIIYALDDNDLKERDLVETTYKAGTKASYILKDLIGKLKLPCAVFKVKRDWTYKDEVKVDGGLMDNIKKYAEVCGISVYINKGKVYARHLSEGDNIYFTVNADTGLIDSPEEFEEEITAEDYKDTIKGYKFKMLLQHRMTTAAIITLKSQEVSGEFRVRSGKHIFNNSESITEVEVI